MSSSPVDGNKNSWVSKYSKENINLKQDEWCILVLRVSLIGCAAIIVGIYTGDMPMTALGGCCTTLIWEMDRRFGNMIEKIKKFNQQHPGTASRLN